MSGEPNSTSSRAKAVVEPIKMPHIKIPSSSLAKLNAWAIALATFFGYATIFSCIAKFTNSWHFELPAITALFGSNIKDVVEPTLITSLASLIFAFFGIITLGKITDANALKKAWGCIAKVFLAIVIIYLIDMLAIAIYSLMSLGRTEQSLDQGQLWLSHFLPTVILCIGALCIFAMARHISQGKTALLRILSVVTVIIASSALIIVFVQQMIMFYGKKTTQEPVNYQNNSQDFFDFFRR